SEISPQPPFLETDLSPVDEPRWTPGSWLSDSEWRPAGGINGSICGGASSAECEQSYGMQPEINRLSFSRDFDGKIVSQHVCFLMCDAAGLRGRHICAIADGVDVFPFGLERVVIHADTGFCVRQPAI